MWKGSEGNVEKERTEQQRIPASTHAWNLLSVVGHSEFYFSSV